MMTKGHVVAKRRELPSAWGGRNDVQVMVRLGCLVCGGGGLVGCSTEGRALEYVETVQWHLGCKLGLVCPCGEPGLGRGAEPGHCFQWPRCGGAELEAERELVAA